MTRRTIPALALLALASCTFARSEFAPLGSGLTRLVTEEVYPGGTIEVRGHGLVDYVGYQGLALVLMSPGLPTIKVPARVGGDDRVLGTLGPEHLARLGARTLQFSGDIKLNGKSGTLVDGRSGEPLQLSGQELTIFPPNAQRVVAGYEVHQALCTVTCKLGIKLDHPEPEDWQKGLKGIPVREVADAAAEVGIVAGDRLFALNGKQLNSWADLRVAALSVEDTVEWAVRKEDGKLQGYRFPTPWRGLPSWIIALLIIGVVCGIVLGIVMLIAGFFTLGERRIAGRMQFRIGPNRVGPNGLIQWMADGLKLIQKEDLVPEAADPILFRMAPYIVFTGMFLAMVAVPFSSTLIPQDLNIGILYILAITSVVVIGILMSGWASNNKWSLLGGMRSAAQIVSYEVPASLAVLPVILAAGSLSMQAIVRDQGGLPWEWNVFAQPALFACFFIFFTAGLAEGNRIPFDLPECESELVSGYNTEYSGFRFAVFFLGEFANIYLFGAIGATLFLGGWRLPTIGPLTEAAWVSASPVLCTVIVMLAGFGAVLFAWLPPVWRGFHPLVGKLSRTAIVLTGVVIVLLGILVPWPDWFGMEVLRLGVFVGKALLLSFVVIWLRWTLPRVRIDQLMGICWKVLVPFAFAAFIFTALWEVFVPETVEYWLRLVWFLFGGLGIFFVFAIRVWRSFSETRATLYPNPFA